MRVAEFVQSYFDAWNHSDARGVAEHLAKHGTYLDVPLQEQHSRDELVRNLAEYFALDRNRYQLIGEVLASEHSIAFQYRICADDPGQDDRFGAEFMLLDDDGVSRISDYYDAASTLPSVCNEDADKAARKYAKSGLDAAQIDSYTRKLTVLMEGEKVYLESDLSLLGLARRVGCSVNHLSQAVNAGFGLGFFDFLNSYRVAEAKAILSESSPQPPAILDVSFAVGFNSNSAFYNAFKKATGQTPAQFRRASLTAGARA